MVLDSLLPKSLRIRLMVLVALAMTPIAVMTLVNTWQEYDNAIRIAEENLVRLTRLAAANEAQSIEGARQILVDISSFPNLLDDNARCSELLHNILRQNKSYANFGVIQMNGDVTCSAIPSARPVNLGDRLHFKRAVQERRFIAGNYVFGRVIQKHTINLTYPIIHADNEVKAVVFAAMDLEDLDSFVRDINLPAGSILITADAEGKIISRQPDPQAWFGKSVSEVMMKTMQQEPGKPVLVRGVDGVERLHAFARVGGADISEYTLTIGIPRNTIIANAQRGQMLALGALAATILLAMLAAWLIGNILIVRRIERLVDTADRIASGSLDTRTGIRYGNEEIGKLARALDKMASALQVKEAEQLRATEELRSADRRKDEFLAMLAHELRNPLAPISTGAQILLLQHGDDPHIGKTLEIISRQVDHMTSLVDDLLDVSRVTRGLIVIERERLDVKQIVSDALDQASPLISTHGHVLDVRIPDESIHVNGDYKRLVQVLTNLLNNAAKYTPAGGRITFEIEALPEEVILSVTDNGQGMPPELIQRVFELFVQAERTSDRSEGGLGLGLALVKSLVELHGGSVSARSAGPGKGSTFTVRLPRLAEDGNLNLSCNDTGHMAAVSSRMRVLVVDDNVDATRTLSSFLSVLGYDVRAAFNGANALVIAREWHPQVCLLDIGLPDIDGRDLAATLRRTPETAQSVLIAITGYGQESDRRTALEAGFHHYFVKPVSTQELSHVLAEIKPC